MAELPGPRPLPIIGSLHKVKKPVCLTFSKFGRIYGEVFQIRLGSKTTVILNSAAALRQAFGEQGDAFSYRADDVTGFKIYKEIRGEENIGLTTRSACTDIWYAQHKVTKKAIGQFVFPETEDSRFEDAILSEASKLASAWLGEKDNSVKTSCVIDPIASWENITTTLKAVYILGDVRYEIEDFDKRLERYKEASVRVLELLRSGFINDFLPCLGFLTRSKQNEMRDVLSVGAQFFDDIYKAHHVRYQEGSKDTIMDCFATFHDELEREEPERPRVPRKTVLGIIPELFEGVPNNNAAFLQIMLYMIYFPEVQDNVRDELHRVIGVTEYPSLEDRRRLPYTEAAMHEVWRHSSIINVTVPHTSVEDTVLGGRYNYYVPKGATLIGNLYAVHKDPKVWDKPEEFNPKRFINENGSLDEEKVKEIMIFSIGRRSCIAELIVKRELFLLYSTLMHLCQFEDAGSNLTMQNVGGVAVPRDGSLKVKITRTEVDISSGSDSN